MGRLPPSFDQLIRPLRSLRLLDFGLLSFQPLSLELAQSLASLPLFTELILQQHARQPTVFELTVETLRCIAESRSWRLIRVPSGADHPMIALPEDVDARLAEQLTAFRVQKEWLRNGRTNSHQMICANGSVAWALTPI